MNVFERYLTLWVFLCIVVGIVLGQLLPGPVQALGRMEFAQVNIPVGLLIWVMIIPMLVKVDFGALHEVRSHLRGIGVTLAINWLVKPFSMALLGWIFVRHLFAPLLPADQIDSYIAGLILLAAAPCTAMVFVWSRLTNGDPLFTLSQVALNDSIMIFAFVEYLDHLGGSIHCDSAAARAGVAQVAAGQRRGALRSDHGAHWPVVGGRAAGDPGAAICLSGQGHHRTTAGDCATRCADSDSGVFQFRAGLLAQSCGGRKA